MIVYDNVKSGFIEDLRKDILVAKIEENYREKIGGVKTGEKTAWENSLKRVVKIINNKDIPEDAGVAVEYKVPETDRRIDFMISGYSEEGKGVIIIIELKQWSKVDEVPNSLLVRALVSKNNVKETSHPSRQALNYAGYLSNLIEPVIENKIILHPCSYLHNYAIKENDPLLDNKFDPLFKQSPVFTMDDEDELRDFIKKYIKKGDREKVLFELDNGNIVPSRRLQDDIANMIEGKKQFYLLETQQDVYEKALNMAEETFKTNEKHVLIVKGGPGTGKSAVAIQLFAELYQRKIIAHYTTMNGTPRNVYFKELKNTEDQEYVRNLFTGAYSYDVAETNEVPVIIVDEAHRLKQQTYVGRVRGNNQIREIINAANFSIFFIDEDQMVTDNDIGTIEEIKRCCDINGVKTDNIEQMELESQFRCKGSTSYIAWLDDVLQIRKTANNILDTKEYDFKVVDTPDELDKLITERNSENKSRLVAGYYKEWISKKDPTKFDFELSETFRKKWNLAKTKTWAIDKNSINEIGCIHTCQGLEFDYIGVIIGTDLRYENGKIITDLSQNASSDKTALVHTKALYKKNPEKAKQIADRIIKNTYKVLMTRGLRGCYIYCEDKPLAEYIKGKMKPIKNYQYAIDEEEQIEYLQVAEESEKYKYE